MGNIFSALVTTNYNTVYCGIYNCKGTCLPYFLLMDTSIRLFVSGRLYFLCCRVLFLKNMFVGDGFGYQVVDYNWRQFHSFLSYVCWFFFLNFFFIKNVLHSWSIGTESSEFV